MKKARIYFYFSVLLFVLMWVCAYTGLMSWLLWPTNICLALHGAFAIVLGVGSIILFVWAMLEIDNE